MSHAIELALTPVFLLMGITGILSVVMARLSRIVDRGRQLTEGALPSDPKVDEIVRVELRSLEHRRNLASAAITACTISALLVCTVIAALFLEVLLQVALKWPLGVLFTSSTVTLVAALAFLLREVQIATRTVRIPISAALHR